MGPPETSCLSPHTTSCFHHGCVHTLACVSPILPHRQLRCIRRRVWGQALLGCWTLCSGHSPAYHPTNLASLTQSPSKNPLHSHYFAPGGSRLQHSHAQTPSLLHGWVSTSSAMSTDTVHVQGMQPGRPLTCSQHCLWCQALRGAEPTGAQPQGWLRRSRNSPVPQLGSNQQTAAGHSGG